MILTRGMPFSLIAAERVANFRNGADRACASTSSVMLASASATFLLQFRDAREQCFRVPGSKLPAAGFAFHQARAAFRQRRRHLLQPVESAAVSRAAASSSCAIRTSSP